MARLLAPLVEPGHIPAPKRAAWAARGGARHCLVKAKEEPGEPEELAVLPGCESLLAGPTRHRLILAAWTGLSAKLVAPMAWEDSPGPTTLGSNHHR